MNEQFNSDRISRVMYAQHGDDFACQSGHLKSLLSAALGGESDREYVKTELLRMERKHVKDGVSYE